VLRRALTLLLLAIASCEPPAARSTYHEDAEPILRARCVPCHSEGGVGPIALATYADAAAAGSRIEEELETGRMPPFPPDPACRPLDDARIMSDRERTTLLSWLEAGAPEGDPAARPPAPALDPSGPPTDEFDSGIDYSSDAPEEDDYRCFVVDPGFDEAVDAVALDVRVDGAQAVHHAAVYAAPPGAKESVDALDAADPGPGWECFGGAGFAQAVRVGAYVPGSRTLPFPDGAGVRLSAGTRFVVQMHYNFHEGREPSRFSVRMWRAGGPLAGVVHEARVGTGDIVIPAGDPDVRAAGAASVVGSAETPEPLVEVREGRAWAAGAHMHLLGAAIRLDVVHADASRECLLDVPRWDFDWQGEYRFAAPVDVVAGDRLEAECRWDNSAANQPAGEEPHDVAWGWGTADEMCLAWLLMTNLSR